MAGLFIIEDPRPNIRETPPLSDATQAGRRNDEARPLNRHLLLVRPGSLLGNSIDLRPGARVIPQEAAKICSTQHEHPAIAERHDVGLARPSAQQRHLAKKVAAPQPHALVRQYHFDRTGGDQEHGIAAVALADDHLAGNQQPRPEQAGERSQFSGTEAGEHVELSEQILGVQSEIERRELIHQQAERLVLPLQILEHLLSDQPLVVEIVKS